MKSRTIALCAAAALAGCASKATEIPAAYVSPMLYQNLTCEQLHLEAMNVSSRVTTATGAQNKKASDDAALMAVGLVLFWPAILFTSGDDATAAELGRLKGEMQAIESAAIVNDCKIAFNKG